MIRTLQLPADNSEGGMRMPPGWYDGLYYPQGIYLPAAVSWQPSPSPKVELNPGDTLRINMALKYRGPAQTRRFRAALGNNSKSGSFDEWLGYASTRDIDLPAKATLTTLTGLYIDIPVPTSSTWWEHSGEEGAVYAKIENGLFFTEGENITPYYYDAVYVIAAEGEFSGFAISGISKV